MTGLSVFLLKNPQVLRSTLERPKNGLSGRFLLELSASAAERRTKQQESHVFLVEALVIDSLGVRHNSQIVLLFVIE